MHLGGYTVHSVTPAHPHLTQPPLLLSPERNNHELFVVVVPVKDVLTSKNIEAFMVTTPENTRCDSLQ